MDHEKVLLDVKRAVAAKSHHGQRELFAVIAQAEVEHAIDEGLPDKALRLYGLEFYETVIAEHRPNSEGDRVPSRDGQQVRALRGDSNPESEEDTDDRSNAGDGGQVAAVTHLRRA